MTTIAYNHKEGVIAWDSRSTSGNIITSDSRQKMTVVNGVRFWIGGVESDRRKFIEMYFSDKCDEFYPDCCAFVYDKELFICGVTEQGEFWRQPTSINSAIGSGRQIALSGMLTGMSAREAVNHAKKLDCYTGGKVRTFKLK